MEGKGEIGGRVGRERERKVAYTLPRSDVNLHDEK